MTLESLPKIYEDNNLLVIDKPAGLIVNNSHTAQSETLQSLIYSCNWWKYNDTSEFCSRGGIIHRLDKDTSGVLVVAKDPETFVDIQAKFKRREVTKTYHALLFNRLPEELLEVNAALTRDPRNRLRYAVAREGREAITRFKLLKNMSIDGNNFSYCEISPYTGRTHQIRVHAKALDCPVVHDPIYGTKKQLKWAMGNGFSRLMLHAFSLSLQYKNEQATFTSVIPSEFQVLL